MRFFVFALLAVCALSDYTEKLFADWTAEHGKSYANNVEAIRRYNIFKSNLEWIIKRNTELEHMQVGLNHFADLTQEEFEATYLSNLDDASYNATMPNQRFLSVDDLDHLPKQANGKCATPVRSQGMCGSCWAFSAAGALEGFLCWESETEENAYKWVSTQELVDCTCNGCNGGLAVPGLAYYLKNGICEDSEYPYTAELGTCQSSKCKRSGFSGVNTVKDSDGGILKALATNFQAVSIDARSLDFRFYKSGTFMPGVNCDFKKVNHAVTAYEVVGKNYHIKNSWGPIWGDKGFFDMPAKVNCMGIEKRGGTFPYA